MAPRASARRVSDETSHLSGRELSRPPGHSCTCTDRRRLRADSTLVDNVHKARHTYNGTERKLVNRGLVYAARHRPLPPDLGKGVYWGPSPMMGLPVRFSMSFPALMMPRPTVAAPKSPSCITQRTSPKCEMHSPAPAKVRNPSKPIIDPTDHTVTSIGPAADRQRALQRQEADRPARATVLEAILRPG